MIEPDYIAYTDGGARGNPGPAGAGAVIYDRAGVRLDEAWKALGVQTNNFAEYHAVILAIETLKRRIGKDALKAAHVEIRMDSELVCRQLNGMYQVKDPNIAPLFLTVWNMRVADVPHLTCVHIPREKNGEADALSNKAMDEVESTRSQGTLV